MTDTSFGRIEKREDGGLRGVLSRTLGHDAERVWSMLVEPASLAQWLAPGAIEPRVGGAVKIDFSDSGTVIDSQVTSFEPLHLLEYSWSRPGEPQRPLRWSLAPCADGTVLTLAVGIPAGEDAAKACAGFEGHLEMLAAALEGVSIKFPFDLFLSARAAYRAQSGG